MNREAGNDILFVEHLTKKPYFEDLSFVVNHNDKIVFLSENTHITTTLFDILMGKVEPDSGSFKWGVTITKDYLPQDNQEFFNKSITLSDWIRNYSTDQTDTFIRGWLGRMLFSGEDAFKPVDVLSGGERVRCMLSKIMLSGANVVLLDDPSNHLDLETITSLNQGLIRYRGNLLFTSHDHEIIQTVANRIIEFLPDRTVFDKEMTYDDYITQYVNTRE